MDVPWRSKRHPIFRRLMVDEGRRLSWLAARIGYSHQHVKNVSAGSWPASARFRAACAALVGARECDLFEMGGTDSVPPRDGSRRRGAKATTKPREDDAAE